MSVAVWRKLTVVGMMVLARGAAPGFAQGGGWQVPGRIQVPRGPWQVPGRIEAVTPDRERPVAVLQTPGAVESPGAVQSPGAQQSSGPEASQPGEIYRGPLEESPPAQPPPASPVPPAVTPVPQPTTAPARPEVEVRRTECQERLSLGSDTLFEFNRADLTPTAERALANLGPMIARAGAHPAMVEGHTDAIGSIPYNLELSERRARTVRDWLSGHGYLAASTPIRGWGKSHPVAPNVHPDGTDDPAGRSRNRRVEVVIDTCH